MLIQATLEPVVTAEAELTGAGPLWGGTMQGRSRGFATIDRKVRVEISQIRARTAPEPAGDMAADRRPADLKARARTEVANLAAQAGGAGESQTRGRRTSGNRSDVTSPAVAIEPRRVAPRKGRKSIRGPRKEPGLVRFMSAVFTIAAVTLIAVGLLVSRFDAPGPLPAAKTFVVPRGENANDIAERLERDGIIANRWTFMAMLITSRLTGAVRKGGDFKAGAYEFKAAASMRDVADVLMEGKSALIKITIPEGLTSAQIVERLKANDSLTGEISAVPPEGSLLPDTVVVQRGTARQEIVERMQSELQKVLTSAWDKRATNLPRQIATPQDALILASIVEKETGRADERPRVAAVFMNRLRKNMRLQSDPTIIYGITLGAGPLGRPIYRSDIDQKTAYNTYQIDGLPPGPIANVGRLAIEAALNPATTNDIYFVADGTGGHTFSETLKDHNAAVANWRRVEREAKAAKDAQKEAAAQVAAGALPSAAGPATGVRVNGQQVKAAPSSPQPNAAAVEPAEPETASTDATIPLPVRKPKR